MRRRLTRQGYDPGLHFFILSRKKGDVSWVFLLSPGESTRLAIRHQFTSAGASIKIRIADVALVVVVRTVEAFSDTERYLCLDYCLEANQAVLSYPLPPAALALAQVDALSVVETRSREERGGRS